MEELKRTDSFELEVPPDYSFYLTCAAYSFPWQFNGKRAFLALSVDPPCIAVAEEREGVIEVRVYGEHSEDASGKVSWILGLHEDHSEYYELASRDPLLKEVPRALRGHRVRACDIWSAFLVAVCQQNASFKQGWGMLARIYVHTGSRVRVEGCEVLLPPTPRRVLELGASVLREKCRVGYRAETIIRAAEVLVEGGGYDELCRVKGVGEYTSSLVAVLGLRDYSKLPLDRWLAAIAREVYGVEGGLKVVARFLREKWGRWAGLAALHVTLLLDAVPLREALRRVRCGEVRPRREGVTPLTLFLHGFELR